MEWTFGKLTSAVRTEMARPEGQEPHHAAVLRCTPPNLHPTLPTPPHPSHLAILSSTHLEPPPPHRHQPQTHLTPPQPTSTHLNIIPSHSNLSQPQPTSTQSHPTPPYPTRPYSTPPHCCLLRTGLPVRRSIGSDTRSAPGVAVVLGWRHAWRASTMPRLAWSRERR